MTFHRKIMCCLLSLSLGLPALSQPLGAEPSKMPPIVVSYDMGGSLQSRQNQVRELRRAGQRVEIRGACYSACTMYLGLRNVCVAPDAVLGFHGPKGLIGSLEQDVFDHWSKVMARNLRKPLQRWFMAQARYVSSGVMQQSGAQLIAMGYSRC